MSGKYQQTKKRRGFTIILLTIVLTVVSIALLGYLSLTSGQSQQRVFIDNQAREAYIMQTISQFAVQNGYIPCPAPVSIAQGSPGYGVANCVLATANTASPTLLAGLIPFQTLGLDPARYSLDSWGNHYSYVMDKNLSTPAGFATATSAMVLNYPDGTQTNPAVLVISHGKSGMGAPIANGSGNVTINPTVYDAASLNNAMCGGGWPTPQGMGQGGQSGPMPVPAGVTCNGQFYVAAPNLFNEQKSSGFDNVLAWRTIAQIINPAGGGGSGMAGSGGSSGGRGSGRGGSGGSGGTGGSGGSGGSGGGSGGTGGGGGSGGGCLGLNSSCIHVLIPCCSPFSCINSSCQ